MMSNVKLAKVCDATTGGPSADLHGGEATGLFTTSMSPTRSDIMAGEGTELFTTSMGPTVAEGEGTGLYTTSMVGGRDAHSGEATGLFTTSMTPVC